MTEARPARVINSQGLPCPQTDWFMATLKHTSEPEMVDPTRLPAIKLARVNSLDSDATAIFGRDESAFHHYGWSIEKRCTLLVSEVD